MSKPAAPPPVISFARVLSYAIVDASVSFKARRSANTDGTELGRVPRLALCQSFDDTDTSICLFHCDEEWNVLGASGDEPALQQAKTHAEQSYAGIAAKWVDTDVSEASARHWLEEHFPASLCSFCGRLPPAFETLFRGHRSGICGECVRSFAVIVEERASGKDS
jgi:hypothetical protein